MARGPGSCSAPHAPLNPEPVPVPEGAYSLIPEAPLAPSTLYTVQVDGIVNEEPDGKPGRHTVEWSFGTGS